MRRGEHLARVLGLAVIGGGILVAPVAPAAGEEPYELMWGKLFGTVNDDYSHSVMLDADGYVIICGWMGVTTSFTGDILLAKYTPSGTLLWSRQYGTTTDDSAHDVATDSAGNIYIAGRTNGSLFGPRVGSWDAFLAKYSPSGDLLWGRQFGTATHDHAEKVVVDSEDHVYICGWTSGALFGTSAGETDSFIAKYDSAGTPIWGRQFGTGLPDLAFGLAIDTAGDLLVGVFYSQRAVLAKYTPWGDQLWFRPVATFPEPSLLYATDMTLDAAGNTYFVGDVYDEPSETYSALVMKTDAEGALLWSRQHGTVASWSGVAMDGAGNAYVAGSGARLAKYDPSGAQLWLTEPTLGARSLSAWSIALDSAGNLFISGLADRLFGIPGAGGYDALVARFRPACYADCDGSGATDFFDFLCFQNLFTVGDIRADCDGSEVLDFLDFLCFQDAFAAGCPE